jgi:chemotaxis response regulator CheB
MRVALVEDSVEFIRVVEALLAEIPGSILVGTASDSATGIELVSKTQPDVLVLDVFLREGTALDVLRGLADQTGRTTVIVVTSQPSAVLEQHCRNLGARAVFDKTTQVEQLFELLQDQRITPKADE